MRPSWGGTHHPRHRYYAATVTNHAVSTGAAVVADGLTVSYGPTTALSDVSLSVDPGEIVSIAGPSGSGKSTLLHCLAGLLEPDAGSVTIDDVRITDLDHAARTDLRLERFGFVFQFGHLIPELSLLDNVALPQRLRGESRAAARQAAADLLARLGLNEQQDKAPAAVSGGQYQRAAVARALVTRPSVVFGDEPTGALDSVTSAAVLEEFTALAREAGSTVLIVSHDDDVVAGTDRVIRLRDGRIET